MVCIINYSVKNFYYTNVYSVREEFLCEHVNFVARLYLKMPDSVEFVDGWLGVRSRQRERMAVMLCRARVALVQQVIRVYRILKVALLVNHISFLLKLIRASSKQTYPPEIIHRA